MVGVIGSFFTFWPLATFDVLGWIWIYYRIPETKGRSLDQIEKMLQERARRC